MWRLVPYGIRGGIGLIGLPLHSRHSRPWGCSTRHFSWTNGRCFPSGAVRSSRTPGDRVIRKHLTPVDLRGHSVPRQAENQRKQEEDEAPHGQGFPPLRERTRGRCQHQPTDFERLSGLP